MSFLTELHVHRDPENKRWILTEPLVWAGDWETMYIKPGFVTDFASVPRFVRWLLDSGGRNAAPGVLHDVAWRESKRTTASRRVDPWHADGMFRRALRYSGLAPIPRNMIWVGVRLAAIFSGRLGQKGPKWYKKVLTVLIWTLIGLVIVVPPVAAILVGYGVYWVFGLLAALATVIYTWYRSRGDVEYRSERRLPRLDLGKSDARQSKGCIEHLLVIAKTHKDAGRLSAEQLVEPDTELSELLDRYLAAYKASNSKLSWKDSVEAQELQSRSQCGASANRQPQ
jgi:hypothetical protein